LATRARAIIKPRIIMGIDPGTNILGYGIIACAGNNIKLQAAGVVRLDTLLDPYLKLKRIHERVTLLIKDFKPTEFAIEAPFFGKNVQSMLKLGRAQGVAISVAMTHNVKVIEYSPKKIKMSITGNGNASKEQVATMIKKYLHFAEIPTYLDTTDALAVALCHSFQPHPSDKTVKKTTTWKSYISEYPDKIKTK